MRGKRIQIPQKRTGPASKTPFDGLGSSREHKCENSLNLRGIAIELYRGWKWGGLCAPSLPWIHVCMRIMPLCVSVEFLCLSVCLSKSLYNVCLSACLSSPSLYPLSLSLSLSLSICGVDLADQGSRARYRAIQVFSWDSKSVPFPSNLSW